MGSGNFDTTLESKPDEGVTAYAYAGHGGGAVGGTPANKRAAGGRKRKGRA